MDTRYCPGAKNNYMISYDEAYLIALAHGEDAESLEVNGTVWEIKYPYGWWSVGKSNMYFLHYHNRNSFQIKRIEFLKLRAEYQSKINQEKDNAI